MMLKKSLLLATLFAASVYANEYQEWLQMQQSGYSTYKKSLDQEFSDMLKKDWESFQQMSNPSPYVKPKPKEIPKIQEIEVPTKEIRTSPKVIIKPLEEKTVQQPAKKIEKLISVKKEIPSVNLDFFGNSLKFNMDERMKFHLAKIDKEIIIAFWDKLSGLKNNLLINQIKQTQKALQLNDWGTYQLVFKLGQNFYNDENSATLFVWYIFTKLGFDTKVGYNTNKIYLLSTTKQKLYQVAYYTLQKKRYYILTPTGKAQSIGKIYTYTGNYPKANQKISFDFKKEILLTANRQTKKLHFSYNGENYSFPVEYSSSLVDFYRTFPQSDYQIYYKMDQSTLLTQTMLEKISKMIENKTELEAVNLILRLVQKSFAYQTDQQQFDYEKVMFPEETINYPYSDCEDRSIIFTYIVKKLLGLDVVGIKYKDHMSAAVSFSSRVSGDGFRYKGKIFIMTDPTYINANSGMTMPQYKNSKFEIIGL
jgi:hypothetical protein